MNELKPSTLYIVGTPIGNLQDITLRALRVLDEADHVYAEDTRVTHGMLQRHNIKRKLFSYREAASAHQVENTINEIIFRLNEGASVAYVSDAGTPGVSDPGNHLVGRVIEAGLDVVPIPGVSALASLLSVSGFAAQRPLFIGFLPKKKGHQTLMGKLKAGLEDGLCDTIVIYESPERIVRLLKELTEWELPLQVCIGRELTKLYEELIRGELSEVLSNLEKRATIKGEISLVLHYSRP